MHTPHADPSTLLAFAGLELAPAATAAVAAHLATGCAVCRRRLERVVRLVAEPASGPAAPYLAPEAGAVELSGLRRSAQAAEAEESEESAGRVLRHLWGRGLAAAAENGAAGDLLLSHLAAARARLAKRCADPAQARAWNDRARRLRRLATAGRQRAGRPRRGPERAPAPPDG